MQPELLVFPVVTHTAHSNARTGIQTVTRGVCNGLDAISPIVPLAWHARRGYLHGLKSDWAENVGKYEIPNVHFSWLNPYDWLAYSISNGRHSHLPLHLHPNYRRKLSGAWLLLPELMEGHVARAITSYARHYKMKVSTIFHDAIPLLRPDVTERKPDAHESYMRALAEMDLVLTVSETSALDLQHFWNKWNVTAAKVCVIPLPAEVPGQPRICSPKLESNGAIQILCVSTLEPRKNQPLLVDSFLDVEARHPGQKLELQFVGNRYRATPEIAWFLKRAASLNKSITWHENIEWDELRKLYATCDFTVYPSFLEGFGLPIMESLWFARPCVCASFGVMQENARDGGCLTTDVNDRKALANAIEKLALRPELRAELSRQAIQRPLTTWRDYAGQVLAALTESV